MGARNPSSAAVPGTKGAVAPGARAKEAPGPAPGPRGPRGDPLKQPGVPTGGTLWRGRSTRWNGSNEICVDFESLKLSV